MDLAHEKLTQQEAADELKVRINNQLWQATRIRIVRRKEGDRTQWVHMVIVDTQGGMQMEYFMERLSMIKAWLALDLGEITADHINALILELNGCRCKVLSVDVLDESDEQWVQMSIECIDGTKQIIAIERQSMINAYYALRLSIEDMVETAINVVGSFLE